MKPEDKIAFLNTYYHNLTEPETIGIIKRAIENNIQIHHTSINAAKVVAMQQDNQLLASVNDSDIINIDGQAVVWAARFLNKPVKQRVAGIDLMSSLVDMAGQNGFTIYLLGAKEEVVSKLAAQYRDKYGVQIISGYRNGYFTQYEEATVFSDISARRPDMLFVAISSPKKENLLYTYKKELKSVNLIMGVGGSFDVLAGYTQRAPVWMQKSGLEWFFRFIQEPGRMWKRYLVGNSRFMYLLIKEKLMKVKTGMHA
ncbi:MAG TPA: WecB/TagA/CpsF family glycosyltransferase [Saprospiraceae bacterium]|nr:WecB/TagA/CpsF family glycosyltransferase [Saprospiraceae bacterium]HRO08189.1 WecB/TagA/CpsF family glycosyltransferase [Saprospiraceae bacterium]HRP41582.1 WecB/TagA/CpsF family glycosyltransferase [Saprospiraceae bacterium]